MTSSWKLLLGTFVISIPAFAALMDRSAVIIDRDAPIMQIWPAGNKEPNRINKKCANDTLDLLKVDGDKRTQYEAEVIGYCIFNEYRQTIYMGCVRTLAASLLTANATTVPAFCARAHSFSLNDYENYTTCVSRIYGRLGYISSQIASFCERSRGRKSVVDCLMEEIAVLQNEGASPPAFTRILEACISTRI